MNYIIAFSGLNGSYLFTPQIPDETEFKRYLQGVDGLKIECYFRVKPKGAAYVTESEAEVYKPKAKAVYISSPPYGKALEQIIKAAEFIKAYREGRFPQRRPYVDSGRRPVFSETTNEILKTFKNEKTNFNHCTLQPFASVVPRQCKG